MIGSILYITHGKENQMFFILLFICSWIWFFIQFDRSRIRELYGVMIYTSFLGLFTDLLMIHYKLWEYQGLPQSKFLIPLLLDFSVYPVVAFLFIQNITAHALGILRRVLIWTIFSVILEWITMRTGHIEHHSWWNLWLSFAADILIYLSTWGVYKSYVNAFQKQKLDT